MSSLHERLAALDRRLQVITRFATEQGASIKVEDCEIDSANSRYVCAECAWTVSTNASALAHHFTFVHTSHLKCLDCKSFGGNQKELKKHRSQKHRHLCLSCQKFFPTKDQCEHHEPCESQRHVAANTDADAPSPTTTDQSIYGKAPANLQSILNRKSSVQSGSCPDPACRLTFLDFNTLYEHYIKSHPFFIVWHGHTKPFKCPFCQKRYQHDRFIAGHVRTHKPKSWSIRDAEEQESLIRQSHIAMAHGRSQSHAEAQVQKDHTSSDEEGENSVPKAQEEDYSLLFHDGVVYIDEGLEPESPISEKSSQANMQESRRILEATPIGLVLQAHPSEPYNFHPTNERLSVKVALRPHTLGPNPSDPTNIEDDYPDRFALDEPELPPRIPNPSSSILSLHLSTSIFHQSLSHSILLALRMQHYVSSSEILDLFAHFLDPSQRLYIFNELANIHLDQDDRNVVASLHGTVLKPLLDAWLDFKVLGVRHAANHVLRANATTNNQGDGGGGGGGGGRKPSIAKSITMALLYYSQSLETLIHLNDDKTTAITSIAPHVLRSNFRSLPSATANPPFPHLIAALASRVKNRVVGHDASAVEFTNEMVLRGTRDYVRMLQAVFRGLYPIGAGHEMLWRDLQLL